MVVVDRQIIIVNEAHERCPPARAVIDGARDRCAVGGTLSMQCEPLVQCVGDRLGSQLSQALALIGVQCACSLFDDLPNVSER
jgi:hypothetical protein